MPILTVQLEDDLYEWLNKTAQQQKKSDSTFLKELLELYREDYEDGQPALDHLNRQDAQDLTTKELETELGI